MRALITGARGQDGMLLRDHLERQGHEVLGVVRSSDADVAGKMRAVALTDSASVRDLLRSFEPDRVYHLAACHHSSEGPARADVEQEMVQTNLVAVQVLLDGIRAVHPSCRLLVAGSSQMYRAPQTGTRIIDEATTPDPFTFYGRTKAWARELIAHYRASHEMHTAMAILFNHESELRRPMFVTRKITRVAAQASLGLPVALQLRDTGSRTDWSSARDVVAGLQLAIDKTVPEDVVLASGVAHRVEDVLEVAFGRVGLDWRPYVTADAASPVAGALIGDSSLARTKLGWAPRYSFEELIVSMVEADLAAVPEAIRPS